MGWWAQRTKSERILIPFCILALIVGAWVVMTPSGTSNKKLLSAHDASQKTQEAVELKAKRSAEILKLKPEIAQLTYDEAPEQVIPKVIKKLQTTANEAGIHIREVKPLRVKRMGGVTKVPLSVRFSCDFSKTVPFIYNAEDPANKLVIDRLNVSAPDAKSRIVDVEAHVSFYTTNTAAVPADTAAAGT